MIVMLKLLKRKGIIIPVVTKFLFELAEQPVMIELVVIFGKAEQFVLLEQLE
jgi:hypothetical protein